MDKDDIESVVEDILYNDGPDRHTDGSEVITAFIIALLDGKGDEWASKYRVRPSFQSSYF